MASTPDPLDQAFIRLENTLPARARASLHWLHGRRSRPVRIPLGILCIIGGLLWFLPVLGLELLPIGLLLIAHDVPWLRRPVSRFTMWLLDGYDWLQRLSRRRFARDRRP